MASGNPEYNSGSRLRKMHIGSEPIHGGFLRAVWKNADFMNREEGETMKELDELEKIAEKVSHDGWWHSELAGLQDIREAIPEHAIYIAAASPEIILSLIRELKITQLALRRKLEAIFEPQNVDEQMLFHMREAERELYPETEQPK